MPAAPKTKAKLPLNRGEQRGSRGTLDIGAQTTKRQDWTLRREEAEGKKLPLSRGEQRGSRGEEK